MNTKPPQAGTPSGTSTEARRAQVAPLLAAGLSVRAIARETGIPVSAVHRAKCRIKKAPAAAASIESPSYVTRRTIDGVPYDVRRLTIEVYEHKVSEAIGGASYILTSATIQGALSVHCLRRAVCTENLIRVDAVMESLKLAE